ncbi:MAG: PaaI family thioesterase [Oscillospiraceae bacterium]|nr:PaaI family thioesterase [Oscillospiraceae bacterium]
MKITGKQRNSRMCVICGLDNPAGVRAHFYNMEDGSVMSPFRFREEHQSYPGRVHGGMIAAMLDELGLRACWTGASDETWGVTTTIEVKYRKPVPYDTDLIARGKIQRETSRFVAVKTEILDTKGNVLADAEVKYIKMDIFKIAEGISVHDEMCYYAEDNLTEINFEE